LSELGLLLEKLREDIRVKHSMGPIVNSIVDNQNVKGEQCFLERC